MVQPKGHQDRLKYRSCRAATGWHSKNGALLKQSYTCWACMDFHMSWRSEFSAELHFVQLFQENDTFCLKFVVSLLANDPLSYLRFQEKGIIVASSSRVQAAEVWVLASVWQCVLTVSLSDISGSASSARTALLALLVCLICSLCAVHLPIWPQAMERLALSVSALLRIVRSPLSNPPTGWPVGL